jgi:hypothetical protein
VAVVVVGVESSRLLRASEESDKLKKFSGGLWLLRASDETGEEALDFAGGFFKAVASSCRIVSWYWCLISPKAKRSVLIPGGSED